MRPDCPKCGSGQDKVIPIIYGMPGAELGRAADRGEVILRGCIVSADDPQWHCKACGHEWREENDDAAEAPDSTSGVDYSGDYSPDKSKDGEFFFEEDNYPW